MQERGWDIGGGREKGMQIDGWGEGDEERGARKFPECRI